MFSIEEASVCLSVDFDLKKVLVKIFNSTNDSAPKQINQESFKNGKIAWQTYLFKLDRKGNEDHAK